MVAPELFTSGQKLEAENFLRRTIRPPFSRAGPIPTRPPVEWYSGRQLKMRSVSVEPVQPAKARM